MKTVKTVGVVSIVVGIVLALSGIVAYGLTGSQLAAAKVVVAEDAQWVAGTPVDDPLSAYAQQDIIDQHALHSTEGKTYAEMDREDEKRPTAMNASFLRASLFTSILAFGVSALVVAVGLVQVLTGVALIAVARKE